MPGGEQSREPAEIDLGDVGVKLRLWKAREALRQGELSLHSQADTRTNLRGAVTSLLGWSVTGIGFTAAASLSAPRVEWRDAATVATFGFSATALICVQALFPRKWASRGYSPMQILDSALASELEIIEALALGINRDIDRNQAHLSWMARLVRICWLTFAVTPLLALATLKP